MKNSLYTMIVLCMVSVPICLAQSTLDNQIRLADDAFAKYQSTYSVFDLRKCLRPLLMIKLPNDREYETYLPRVTDLWIELFKAIDNAYDPTFDPQHPQLLGNASRSANRPHQETVDTGLLQKPTEYWALKALDDNAIAAFRPFVRYHYRGDQRLLELRFAASQRSLSFKRIESMLN